MQSQISAELQKANQGQDIGFVTVIIPTKNRQSDLRSTLQDLAAQTRRPDEIVIVDQSAAPSLDTRDCSLTLNYIHAPELSGAAEARNVAMDCARGGLWIFLDDDVILEPQYVEEIVKAYSPGITGVSGIITNYQTPPLSQRLFDICFSKGPFSDDRQPIYWRAERLRHKKPQRVRQFGCGVMSFRSEAIRHLRFDPNLTGGSLAEDIDFCAHLPTSTKLVIAPNARLIHKKSAVGRATAHWLDPHSQAAVYMRIRNWHRGWLDDLAFAWLQIGYAFIATLGTIKRRSLEPFRSWRRGSERGRRLGLHIATR